MGKTVEFYFDVGSPASFLAYRQLPDMAKQAGANIHWKPILLGGVFQATGNASPAMVPAKGAWMQQDLQRWAKRADIEFRYNPHFPINTLLLMRGATAFLHGGALEPYLATIMKAMWVDQRNLSDTEELSRVLGAAGIDAEQFHVNASDAATKARLKAATEEAVARGVFGAPTFFVGSQMHFGQDRLDFVREALASS
jgi:2-hydroxychromene-2-carboxylate isomerase